MTTTYTRKELLGLIAARHGQPEGVGEGGSMIVRTRITPEALEKLMAGRFYWRDGSAARIHSVTLEDDGTWTPTLEYHAPPAGWSGST